jgi:hypothetical protein
MTFNEDMMRGHLENGEPLEAAYGVGSWSDIPEPEPEYYGADCPFCGEEAWFIEGQFVECAVCGKTHKDVFEEKIESEDK